MARPKKDIDAEQVKKLAAINCSYLEMAAVLGCDAKTLTNRFQDIIKEGREIGKMSLKRKQYEVAMSGNVTMLIWLGKITLKQVEIRTNYVADVSLETERKSKALQELKDMHAKSAKERKQK